MPVFPLVLSRMVRPGASRPDLSPSSIIRRAGRSFTEPPGLRNSALAYTATSGHSSSKRRMRSNGVLPMRSVIVSPIALGTSVNAGSTASLIGDHREDGLGANQERPILAGKLDESRASAGSIELGGDLLHREL